MRRALAVVVASIAAHVLVAAFALETGRGPWQHSCTLIGADSGVVVGFEDVSNAHPRQRLRIEACVNDACTTRETTRGKAPTLVTVGGESLHNETPVEVAVKISDESGRLVFDDRATVTPTKKQPNGPDCEPTVWVGRVLATVGGDLAVPAAEE
jgi:hypothetical protein